jgi:anaerobic selenocysteine-containing dehydrogenase
MGKVGYSVAMDKKEQKKLMKAKIPCTETGIEIKRTVCNVCCSAFYCGQLAYIKDGKIIKVEGDPDHPLNRGFLCTKGLSTRQYIYSPKRIKTPMKNVGGNLVPISWDEAYSLIAQKLNAIKQSYGPEAVAFYSGIEKWYQPFLQRLSYSFGSPNFCNASGTCFEAVHMAWKLSAGRLGLADSANAGCYVAFSFNQFYSRSLDAVLMEKKRKTGLKFIVIDPRKTPAVDRFADIHLQNYPGTDGAVALGMAHILIRDNHIDNDFIKNHVYGFEQYAEYVKGFDPETVARIAGIKAEDLERAVALMASSMPIAIHESVSPIVHHTNGMQNYRAMIALSAITGCYDRKGGNIPRYNTFAHQGAGFETREEEFIHSVEPVSIKPAVGTQRFALWQYATGYGQCLDLSRQIIEGTPYPIKAVVAFGMNYRMFPQDQKAKQALEKLDFWVDVDLFMTESARMADIVLPACTAAERQELKVYRGGMGIYTKPIIEPLYQSRSDFQIISELSRALNLGDELLEGGYDKCIEYILQDTGASLDDLKKAQEPIHIPSAVPYKERKYTESGYDTPTGKFELVSTVIEKLGPSSGLDCLPTYRSSLDNADPSLYPFILFTGSSISNAYNSRLHHIPGLRSLRPRPQADIAIEDAEVLNILHGDEIEVSTPLGSITLMANPSAMIKKGTISIYHDYKEADVNTLISWNHLDPYSGFAGFKSIRCSMKRKESSDAK